MDIRKVEDLLTSLEALSRQLEEQDASLSDVASNIRSSTSAIRTEVVPPQHDEGPRTRDQIPPKDWAEYEWHDVTTLGDRQRKYIRGLKR